MVLLLLATLKFAMKLCEKPASFSILTQRDNKFMNDMVYMITGIIPYSNGERTTIAVYLNKDKAIERMNKEDIEQSYLDIQMDEYEVDG